MMDSGKPDPLEVPPVINMLESNSLNISVNLANLLCDDESFVGGNNDASKLFKHKKIKFVKPWVWGLSTTGSGITTSGNLRNVGWNKLSKKLVLSPTGMWVLFGNW